MGIFFGVAKISNIFFWVLEIPDIFLGEGQMLGPSLCMQKKCEFPPWNLMVPGSCSFNLKSTGRGYIGKLLLCSIQHVVAEWSKRHSCNPPA